MSKFHINKHGVPAPCRAKKGNCPLGGADTHFDNETDAQAYADKLHESSYGLISGLDKKDKEFVYSGFSVNEFEEQTVENIYDEGKEKYMKKSMREDIESIRKLEEKYGVSTEEIMSRKYVNVFDGIDAEDVRHWKRMSNYIERSDEHLGEWYKGQYLANKRRKEDLIKKSEESIKNFDRYLAEPDISEDYKEFYLNERDEHVKKIDRLKNDFVLMEEKVQRYDERYNEETKERRAIDRMYLHEKDAEIIKKSKSFLYRKLVDNDHAHAITKQLQDLDNRLKIMSVEERAKSPAHYWRSNPQDKERIKKYKNVFFLRNATRENLEEAVEEIRYIEASASLHFTLTKEGGVGSFIRY